MTEKRFPRPKFYYGLDGNIRDEKHIFETRTMPKEDIDELFYDEKHLGSNSLLDLLNEQSETITRLEIDLEDMTEIKNKYKKESEDYLEMYQDTKIQLSELGGKYVARGLNLKFCLQKKYNKVDTIGKEVIKDIAEELGVELE